MEENSEIINIENSEYNEDLDISSNSDAVYTEHAGVIARVSQITLSGRYNKTYKVLSEYAGLYTDNILIENNLLIMAVGNDLAVINLDTDTVTKTVECECQLFGIYKFKRGYFIHGELTNYYLSENFDILWEYAGADIFASANSQKVIEVFDDFITARDWSDSKYFYDENGKFINIFDSELNTVKKLKI